MFRVVYKKNQFVFFRQHCGTGAPNSNDCHMKAALRSNSSCYYGPTCSRSSSAGDTDSPTVLADPSDCSGFQNMKFDLFFFFKTKKQTPARGRIALQQNEKETGASTRNTETNQNTSNLLKV